MNLKQSPSSNSVPNRNVTLADVARAVGVGKATAARALSGIGSVSPATKERVIAAAKTLGYHPDPVMSAFSAYRHKQRSGRQWQPLAFLMPDIDRKSFESAPILDNRSLFNMTEQRAKEFGYHLDLFFGKDDTGLAALARQIYARGYLGLVVETIRSEFTREFRVDPFPTVVIDWNSHSHPLHHIVVDWQQMTSVAVKEALAMGYRRPGFAHLKTEVDASRMGFMWWEKEKLTLEYGPQPELFVWENQFMHTVDVGHHLPPLKKWIKRENPDVIISDNITVYWMLELLKVKIPADIGYIGLGAVLDPREKHITRVEQSFEEQGFRAVELLDKLIRIGERGFPKRPYKVLTLGEWYPGKTVTSPH